MIFNFYPSTQTDGPNGNSVLWVDNLSFNSPITGVSALSVTTDFAMYPNPTTGQVTVKLNGINTSSSTLIVYNVLGEVVLSQVVQQQQRQQQRQLDLSGLSNGIYTVELRSSEGSTQQKLIVQR
jgi:hypothetical protein